MAAVAAMLSICMAVSLFSACGEASFLKLDKSAATMYVGDSLTLVATTDKTDAEIVWSSDATHIATVSGGVVTAVSAGEVTIKAKSGGVKATCDITVIEKQEEKPVEKKEFKAAGYKRSEVSYSAGSIAANANILKNRESKGDKKDE